MGHRERVDLIPQTFARPEPLKASLHGALAELVLETMNEGVWLVNAQAVTTFVNHHTADLLGYEVDEMIGRHVFDFVDEENRAVAARNVERRRIGIEEQVVLKCLRKDGSAVWLLFCSNPIFDRNDGFAGSLAMVADFTKHKDAEARLLSRVEELSARLRQVERDAERERHSAGRQAGKRHAADATPRGIVREIVAASTVFAVMGALVATITLTTTWGLLSSFRGRSPKGESPE